MTEALFFYGIIIVFGVIYIALALMPKKKVVNKTDYFLAGRNLTVFKATCTLIATQLGAALLLGTSQQAYKMGLYSLLFTVGISIGLIILGCGLAGILRSLKIATTTEIFKLRYDSAALQKIASLLVTFTLGGILVSNMVASKLLITSLGFESTVFYILFWAFIILYTMIGGLNAVVLTDLVQVLFIAVSFIGLFVYSLVAFPHAFSLEALHAVQEQFTGQLPDLQILTIMLLMPALFALFEQDLAQIFFASKTKKVATKAAILTTIFILSFGIIPIYLGMQAKLMGIAVSAHESPLLLVVKHMTNPYIMVIIACGILAAIASTADALLCAIGANITQDFSLRFLGLSPLVESKGTILVMGVIILGLSFVVPKDIIHLLVRSYEVPVCTLLIPVLAAYFSKDVQKYAAIGGLVGGATGLFLFNFIILIPFPSIWALVLSFIGYGIGFVLQKEEK